MRWARTIGDLLGEAKASGNLGNTLKVLGRFDEAVVCCQRHLDIASDVSDKVRNAHDAKIPYEGSRPLTVALSLPGFVSGGSGTSAVQLW